jgi:hypothetical protein
MKSLRISDVPAEVRTEHLLWTSSECYRYFSMLSISDIICYVHLINCKLLPLYPGYAGGKSSKMLVIIYQTAWPHVLEGSNLYLH